MVDAARIPVPSARPTSPGRRRRSPRGERGAFLVIAALVLTALMAMAAIAIDLANARQERRQSQGSSDAAALAAAQDLPDAAAVVATAKAYAWENDGVPTAAWIGCEDPGHLPQRPDLGNDNDCISIDESFSRVRVRVPVKDVETYFGGVVGMDSIGVTADATAEAKLRRDDRIIPATVAASSGSGNICIENGGNDSECAMRSSGNFGSFDSRRTRIHLPSQSEQADSLRINYSLGIDHSLSIYGSGGTKVCDVQFKSPCVTVSSDDVDANHLVPYTGNVVPPLTDGVVDNATINTDEGTRTFCGRLRRPDLTDDNLADPAPEGCNHWRDAPGPGPSISVLGESVNGRHVSYWMKPEFRAAFYPGATPSVTASTSSSWSSGDLRLECFMRSYRFDYGGEHSKGHVPQTEFFIDPTQPIDPSTGDGTEFTLPEARAYLSSQCGLPASFVDAKLASLTDGSTFWPMFDRGVVTDARFGMIPVVKNWSSGSSTAMQIVRFWAIYLYRLYPSPTKLKALDAWVFEPALIETESGIADLQFGYRTETPVVRLVD